MTQTQQKIFVVLNPKAGQAETEELRTALASQFAPPAWDLDIHEMNGDEDVTALCREASQQGAGLVVAAGGDGTVVSVANALVHRPTPLGILPLGTGNLLARVLNIPLKLDEAVALLAGEHAVTAIDVLKVAERYFLSNVSVGISPAIMQDTSSEQKQRLGMLAYMITILKRLNQFNLHRYTVTLDGQPRRVRATEILVSNPTLLEKATLLYGPPETLQDGQLEVYLARAETSGDILHLLWELLRGTQKPGEKLDHWESRHSLRIESSRRPRLVQGDGEVIGQTPVEVELVPKAIHVIMPM